MAGSISSMGLYCFFELLPLLCFEALVLLLVGADLADERGAELLRIPAMTPGALNGWLFSFLDFSWTSSRSSVAHQRGHWKLENSSMPAVGRGLPWAGARNNRVS